MEKDIYHGSPRVIAKPKFGLGREHNDYGFGFYCTESEDMAKEWSTGEEHDGFANHYRIETDGLRILDLNAPGFTILHWLAILLENRIFTITSELANDARAYLLENFKVDHSKADVICGYRADDSYFSFAQDFLNGTISVGKLAEAMRLGELGLQFVLKSRKAFSRVEFVGASVAARDEWYAKKLARDGKARRDYLDSHRKRVSGQLYVNEILDKGLTADDPRIRQILS